MNGLQRAVRVAKKRLVVALACVAWAVLVLQGRSQSLGVGSSAYAGTDMGFQADESKTGEAGEQASWNLTPTLAGGATASISGIDPARGFAFAMDGYYTPYGKDMKGGGISTMLEGKLIGGRLTVAMCQGHMDMNERKATTTVSYWALDLYLRHAIVKNLYAYGGVGVASIDYDYEYTVPARGRNSSYKVGNGGRSGAMFSCYGGLRWRFYDPLYVFAEYRHDGDAEIEIGDTKTKVEGGGRMVIGGGFMF